MADSHFSNITKLKKKKHWVTDPFRSGPGTGPQKATPESVGLQIRFAPFLWEQSRSLARWHILDGCLRMAEIRLDQWMTEVFIQTLSILLITCTWVCSVIRTACDHRLGKVFFKRILWCSQSDDSSRKWFSQNWLYTRYESKGKKLNPSMFLATYWSLSLKSGDLEFIFPSKSDQVFKPFSFINVVFVFVHGLQNSPMPKYFPLHYLSLCVP